MSGRIMVDRYFDRIPSNFFDVSNEDNSVFKNTQASNMVSLLAMFRFARRPGYARFGKHRTNFVTRW